MSRDGGASYADARIARYRDNQIATREQQIINVVDQDSTGCGVRALVDGTWGFAATRTLTKAGVAAAAREATAIAKANRIARDKAVQLAPAPAQRLVADAAHGGPIHGAGGGEGVAPAQGERRSDESAGRAIRVQRAVLPEAGAQLREHGWVGDRADRAPELAAHADHGCRAGLLRLPEPGQRRGAGRARIRVRHRMRPAGQCRQVG